MYSVGKYKGMQVLRSVILNE